MIDPVDWSRVGRRFSMAFVTGVLLSLEADDARLAVRQRIAFLLACGLIAGVLAIICHSWF